MIIAFTQTQPPFHLAGEYASLAAALIWAGTIVAYRYWGHNVSPQTLNLFKSLVAVICLSLSVLILRPPFPADSPVCLQFMLSGIAGLAIGDTAFFAALRRLGAQGAACGICLSPPFSAVIAVLLLGETLTTTEGIGVILAVTAVGGVLHFGRRGPTHLASLPTETIVAGVLYVILAALGNSVGLVVARNAFQKANVMWGTLLRTAPTLLVLVTLRGLYRGRDSLRIRSVSTGQVAALAVASFWGTFVALLLYSMGAKYAKAGLAAALTSTFPLWVLPIARIFLKERMNWQCVACTVIAVGGIGLMLIPHENMELVYAHVKYIFGALAGLP